MLSQALRSLASFKYRPAVSGMIALLLACSAASLAQTSSASSGIGKVGPQDRLTQPIVESNRVVLQGTMHPLATAANDRGAVSDGMALNRIDVVLKRSDAQEAALQRAIGEMHQKGSASYHKWLTPDEFGKQYGPSDADIAKVEGWLGSHGFSITKVNPGRQTIEIAGTAGQFKDTFHAAIHSYQVKGATGAMETHYANASAPEIPAALAPVLGGFASLNNFHLKSQAHVLGRAEYNPATHEAKPEWTSGTPSNLTFLLAPKDLAVQYDLNKLFQASTPIAGAGQSIAIVNESNIDIAQVNNYRSLFGLPANPPQVIIDGNDPGIDGINSPYGPNNASDEAYLDVEVSGAVAPAAQINLVIADSTALEDGLALAAERAVASNISPVLSLSFGNCEARLGSDNSFWSNLWEQAAAQGITVLVSSGDSGSAACDNDNTQEFAFRGQAVSGIASTPYNVAVGGTDFYYANGSADFATYWNQTSTGATPTESLIKTIPEQPFNSSQFGLNIYPQSDSSGTTIFAAGGGASTLGLLNASTGAYGPYPKPSWQVGRGDGVRDLPDVSFFGSLDDNGSYTPICASDGDCITANGSVYISGVGGTSVSAPEFAGVMALVNQKWGRQGQANYVLYPLATQFPSAFNDVQHGTNTVPCATTTIDGYTPTDCQTVTTGGYSITQSGYGTTTEGEIGFAPGVAAYSAGAGYDLASGLGTVDAYNLVTNWGSVSLAPTSTLLTATPTSFMHGAPVAISGTVSGSNPTGNVGLLTTSTDVNTQGEANFALTAGSYSGTVDYLPGGTYNLSAYYPGDGANAPSTSAPVTVTVTPEGSTTGLTIYSSLYSTTGNPLPASGATVTYGTPETMSAIAQGTVSKGASGNPTGSVVFLDGSTPLNTAVVNVEGDAEYNAALPAGPHSITAKYSGDGSYGTSTSSAISFTVAKDTPNMSFYFPYELQNGNALNGQTNYLAVSVENSVSSNTLPLGPTGTVTLAGAPSGTPSTATLVPAVDATTGAPEGVAYFAVPATAAAGTYSLSFQYGGDGNYAATTITSPLSIQSSANDGFLSSTVTASASAAQASPAATVTVTATVTGQTGQAAPTGTLVFYATSPTFNSQGQIYILDQITLPSSSTDAVTVTDTFNSNSLFQGTNQILVQYFPPQTGGLYNPSATEVTIANSLNDFSLVPLTTIISVPNTAPKPGTQTDTINLASYNGFTGAVTLTCASPSAGVSCALSTNTVQLTGGGSGAVTLTVNTTGVTAAGTYDVVVTGTDATGAYVHTIGMQVVTPLITTPSFTLSGTAVTLAAAGDNGTSTITVTPQDGFTGTVPLTCTVTGPTGAASPPTCGTASATITGTAAVTASLPINTTATTTAGSYSVVVTGTNGSIVESTTIAVLVVPVAPTFTVSANPTTVTIASQGGTGTSTITVTPGLSGFVGTVSFTCVEATEPTGATEIPTCSAASVALNGTTAATTTLTFNTTAQTGSLAMPLKGAFTFGGGVAMAALLFFGLGMPGTGRRKRALGSLGRLRILSLAVFFAMLAGAAMGCGSGGGGGGSTGPTGGTTTGTYTYTVTGTGTSGGTTVTASTTVTVTVN